MSETVELPTFTIHVKNMEVNPKIDLRFKDAAVTIELTHIKARTLIQQLETALKETRGAIRIKFSGAQGHY